MSINFEDIREAYVNVYQTFFWNDFSDFCSSVHLVPLMRFVALSCRSDEQ